MSDLQDLQYSSHLFYILEIIIAKCEDEIEEYKTSESEEPYDDSTELYEGSILEGRKEFAEYILDFANESLATHTKMFRRGETENPTVWDEPLKESTTKTLATLTPREENILREKFGIGKYLVKEIEEGRNSLVKIEIDALNKLLAKRGEADD